MNKPDSSRRQADANADATEIAEARMREALSQMGRGGLPGFRPAGRSGDGSGGQPGPSGHGQTHGGGQAAGHGGAHGGASARPRPPAGDGEVPVVRVFSSRAAEAAPQGEPDRAPVAPPAGGFDKGSDERRDAEKRLAEQLRQLQTRLGHAELSLKEAQGVGEARSLEAMQLRVELGESRRALLDAQAALKASEATVQALRARLDEARQPDGPARRPGRPRQMSPDGEPEPVKWWLGD